MTMHVKYHGKGPAERIADRLRNSGGNYEGYEHLMANHHVKTHPTRTHNNISHGASQRQHGEVHRGEGTILGSMHGRKREGV
jgi:hypothetical protein